MLRTTVGAALIHHALPPAMRGRDYTLDKKGVAALFDELAKNHPGEYRAAAKRLLDVGRRVAYETGGFSFGLSHMREPAEATALKEQIRRRVDAIRSRPDLDDEAKRSEVVKVLQAHQKPLEDAVFAASMQEKNPLAMQVLNVGRGNKASLKGLRAGDLLYEDQHGDPIPLPVLSAYSQGLRPSEYWAAGYGARKSVIDTKFSTQRAGFFSKQLRQVGHRLVVTREDADDHDPSERRGLPAHPLDPGNEGALLAAPAATYPRDTVLTPKVMKDIAAQGVPKILVRSPAVGGPPEGGVYSKDLGLRERDGRLSPRGDFVGIAAADALGEKLTQGQLSSKHSGGVAGQGAAVSGFAAINNFVQVPKTFPGGATHAQKDGRVAAVEPAPQGGTYVTVAGERHYVPPGSDPAVTPGDEVEAGDVLSRGIPNPAEIVRHKGIGEGRLRFISAFLDAYRNSGMAAERRNVELLARGLIDHVRVTDEFGPHVPDDVIPYQALEASWEPRAGARHVAPKAALGKYLERPVLHHTLGTRVRPSTVRELEEFGVGNVLVHDEPPPFEPVMVRGMASLQHDPDWMTRHLGSNLQKATLEAVHRGRSSDTEGTSFVPAAAERLSFGRHGLTRGRAVEESPRDGDGDGRVLDGTDRERPIRSVLD